MSITTLSTSTFQITIKSKDPRLREDGRREQILFNNCLHKAGTFTARSFAKVKVSVYVHRGQYFTTYRRIAEEWDCTIKQARLQLHRWKKEEKVTIERIKDKYGFDVGVRISHKALFNQEKQEQKKKGNPSKSYKARKYGTKNLENTKKGNPIKNILNKFNIHEKDDVFSGKNEKEQAEILKIQSEMSEIGMNPTVGKRILIKHGVEVVKKYLDLLKISGEGVANKAGWLVRAIEQSYDLQKVERWYESEQALKDAQNRRERAERERLEEEERKRQKLEMENAKIESWKSENGKEAEIRIAEEVLKDFERNKNVLYQFICKSRKVKPQENIFVQVEIRSRILAEVDGEQLGEVGGGLCIQSKAEETCNSSSDCNRTQSYHWSDFAETQSEIWSDTQSPPETQRHSPPPEQMNTAQEQFLELKQRLLESKRLE